MSHDPRALDLILENRIAQYTRFEGDHHIWAGCLNSTDVPIISLPYSNPRKRVNVRRFLFEKHYRSLERFESVYRSYDCNEPLCINPEHMLASPTGKRK